MHRLTLCTALLLSLPAGALAQAEDRPRARDLGVVVGVFEPGANNAITDVAGVRVGHSTVIEGPNVRTGVTAIVPHSGNAYRSRVPAAIHVGNGFGKLLGVTQVRELGELTGADKDHVVQQFASMSEFQPTEAERSAS